MCNVCFQKIKCLFYKLDFLKYFFPLIVCCFLEMQNWNISTLWIVVLCCGILKRK